MTLAYERGRFLLRAGPGEDLVGVDLEKVRARWSNPRKGWLLPSPFTEGSLRRLKAALPPDALVVDETAEAAFAEERSLRAVAAAFHGSHDPGLLGRLVFKYESPLSDYQQVGALFLSAMRRAILADGIGIGKTAQAIVAADIVGARRILVVAPKSTLYQWQREIARFTRGDSSSAVLDRTVPVGEARWHITNYETVSNREGLEKTAAKGSPLSEAGFDLVIVDEAHRIRNKGSQDKPVLRTRAVWRVAHSAPNRFLLTGSPIVNRPHELWALLHCIDPDRYVSFWDFVAEYVQQVWNGYGFELGGLNPQRVEEWRAEIAPRLLRRETALLNLPPLTEEEVWLPLDRSTEKAYLQMERAMAATRADGTVLLAPNVVAQCTRLRQMVVDPSLCGVAGKSVKLEWLKEYLEGNAEDGKVLVFTNFAAFAKRAAMSLDKWHPAVLVGEESGARRERELAAFRNDPKCRVLISTAAGGEGLNLQEARVVVIVDKPWTPSEMDQWVGRSHRRGQQFPVHVYHLLCPGTIDQDLAQVVSEKRRMAEEALSGGHQLSAAAIQEEVVSRIVDRYKEREPA